MNAVGEWEANSRHMAQHLPIRTYVYIVYVVYTYTYTYLYTNKQVNNTHQIHGDGKLETANVRPQNRLVSTHFESFRPNFLIYPSKNVILCWWYMHHIKSEILTFHLSPTLPELHWRVWWYMAKPSHVAASSVNFFASISSMRWLRPNAARSQHARNRVRHVAPHVESR